MQHRRRRARALARMKGWRGQIILTGAETSPWRAYLWVFVAFDTVSRNRRICIRRYRLLVILPERRVCFQLESTAIVFSLCVAGEVERCQQLRGTSQPGVSWHGQYTSWKVQYRTVFCSAASEILPKDLRRVGCQTANVGCSEVTSHALASIDVHYNLIILGLNTKSPGFLLGVVNSSHGARSLGKPNDLGRGLPPPHAGSPSLFRCTGSHVSSGSFRLRMVTVPSPDDLGPALVRLPLR